MKKTVQFLLGAAALSLASQAAVATCNQVTFVNLKAAATAAKNATTGGYGLNMWVTVVDETGKVCQVYTTGVTGSLAGNSEWLGSRIISAQKANTANAFSLDGYAISTANLYSAVQPGGSLFGLQLSNPVDSSVSYQGSPALYGATNLDPLIGQRIGGINVFGGGLALYKNGKKIGAVGVSGDTSCRDHAFAWRVREALAMHPAAPTTGITLTNMDAAGVVQTPLTGAAKGDELVLLGGTGYWNAWGHPACPNSLPAAAIPANGTLTAN
jgi:uncharacterized protein GlcG (DUF336 family)